METTIEIIGAEYKCPKCGETDSRNLDICDGEVIGCECGYSKVPAWAACPDCGESDMDNITPPTDDEFFRCQTCGAIYTVE